MRVRFALLDGEQATADDVLWCDGLALCWKMKRFWDEVMALHWMKVDGKVGCAFSRRVAGAAAPNWPASHCSPC